MDLKQVVQEEKWQAKQQLPVSPSLLKLLELKELQQTTTTTNTQQYHYSSEAEVASSGFEKGSSSSGAGFEMGRPSAVLN